MGTQPQQLAQINGCDKPHRGADCPVSHCSTENPPQCELITIGASQVGAIVGLVVGLVAYFGKILRGMPNSADRILAAEYAGLLLITAVFYFVEELALEEEWFLKLRKLKWSDKIGALYLRPLRWIPLDGLEFAVRVCIVVVFGLAASGAEFLGLDKWDSGIFLMLVIYCLFLFWDSLVVEGGEIEIAASAAVGDLSGAIATIVFFYTHKSSPAVAGVSLVVLLLVVSNLAGPSFKKYATKASCRQSVR